MMKKIIVVIILLALIAGSVIAYQGWRFLYKPNINAETSLVFFVYSNDNFESVKSRLNDSKLLHNTHTFDWVAQKMNLPNHIYAGRYIIPPTAGNKDLVTLLRSGIQEPVKITFNNIRTKESLAQILANQLEMDSVDIAERLYNETYAQKFGFTTENFACMFVPNTYELYWSIGADALFERFSKEYKAFWNDNRREKAKKLDLTPIEISILASIVEKESAIIDEYPVIAGVYLNRLKKGMPLQADPTVVFAVGDFSIKRVLNKHLEINSPYNTYKNAGLPPGPIGIPSPQAIDGVLNHTQHNYLYFCAKADFSGRHAFSKTLRQHNENARLYRQALSKRKIYK